MSKSGELDIRETNLSARNWGRSDLAPGLHRPFFEEGLVTRSIILGSAAVVRRSVLDLEDFPDEIDYPWDLWITYLALRSGLAAYYVSERLARIRIHPGQSVQAVAALPHFE